MYCFALSSLTSSECSMVAKVGVFISQLFCGRRDCDQILHTAAYDIGPCGLKV